MSRETSKVQQVLDWLKAEKQGYESLSALLDQEWECLKRRDITGSFPDPGQGEPDPGTS